MPVKGFSLVEVLVAMALVASTAIGLAELFVVSSQVTHAARISSVATLAAESKMAELRARPWAYAGGTVLSDDGLAVSPSTALTVSAAGFVDYVDVSGQPTAQGLQPSSSSVYVRRWSIQPLPADSANTLVLQVVVAPVTRPQSREVHLVSILGRTAQ